jgi:hypothetical protein
LVGRLLGVGNVSVSNWIRASRLEEKIRPSGRKEKGMEIDEMHTYICQQKLLLDMDFCQQTQEEIHPFHCG